MKFTAKENIQLTEIYRRLGYFKKWDLNDNQMMLAFPNEVKTLKGKDILVPSYKETARVLNWYRLTENGKNLFKKHIGKTPLTEKENADLFNGVTRKNFNISLTV